MKLSLATAAAALAATATASVYSIKAPRSIAVNQNIPLKLINNIDQSSTYQTAITFGLGARPIDGQNILGTAVGSIYLQDGTMPAAPFTRNFTIVDWSWGSTGSFELRAAIFGVYGISGSIGTQIYRANVTVGNTVSDEYVELRYLE